MANETTGLKYILKVNTGTVGTPVWTSIASQRGLTFNPANDMIDVSSKNKRAREFEYGMHAETISVNSLFVRSGADFALLLAADRDGDKIQVYRVDHAVNIEYASALIMSMPQDFPYDGEAVISVELQITGEWTAV